jgi:integrase
MSHIQKRGPGRWRARYRDREGREHSQTFARKVDAERFLAEVDVDQARGRWADPRLGRVTVGQWCEDWWATTVDLADSTRVRTRGILNNYVLPDFGHRQLASVAHLEVVQWIAELSAAGLAPRTIRKIGQTLGQVMAAAADAGMIGVSPCERVRLPDGSSFEPRFLTPGEVATLADAMNDRYRALVLVAAYGGLRFSELAGLRRRRVDVLRGRLEIVEAAVEAGGKVTFKPPKSRAGRRGVPLPTVGHRALAEHLNAFTASSADALVFSSPQGDVLRATTWRRRYWNPAVVAADLAPLRPHDLRHTAVSLWIFAGDDAKAISARAGTARSRSPTTGMGTCSLSPTSGPARGWTR